MDPGTAGRHRPEGRTTDPTTDALRAPGDASYALQRRRPPIDVRDAELAAQMIGRPVRGRSTVAVRCGWGLPAVLQVHPRLEDGTPFPTTFWLTCPLASAAVGRLEAQGVMAEMTARLAGDEQLAEDYAASHERYIAHRESLDAPLPRRVSAGGMPDRVKCLHAAYGHHLATRDNPIGAEVAERVEPLACPAPCARTADDPAGAGGGGAVPMTR